MPSFLSSGYTDTLQRVLVICPKQTYCNFRRHLTSDGRLCSFLLEVASTAMAQGVRRQPATPGRQHIWDHWLVAGPGDKSASRALWEPNILKAKTRSQPASQKMWSHFTATALLIGVTGTTSMERQPWVVAEPTPCLRLYFLLLCFDGPFYLHSFSPVLSASKLAAYTQLHPKRSNKSS